MLALHFFLVSLLSLTSFTNALPAEDSNGYRLARGLPPLPPRNFGRNKPGYEPTPVQRSRASPSPSSVVQYSGILEVRSDNGSTIGYVQNKSGLPVANAQGSALEVKVIASSTQKDHLNIVATGTAVFPSPSYLGTSSKDSSNATIGVGSSNSLLFTNVQRTDASSRPVLSSNNTYVESAIWSINSTTKELAAQYVNPDATLPATFLLYDLQSSSLFFAGDTTTFNSSAALVNLFIV